MPAWMDYVQIAPVVGSGYPYFFPTMFGSGKDGALVATNQTDVGYLGAFGAKEYTSLTIPVGVTWTVAPGTSSGALILAVKGRLTIAGSIIANGAVGLQADSGGSSAGGGTAGGGAGAVSAATVPTQGSNASKFGHGAAHILDGTLGRGAPAGCHGGGGSSAKEPLVTLWPLMETATTVKTFNGTVNRLIRPATHTSHYNGYFGITSIASTISGTGDTAFPVKPTTADYGPWAQVANTAWLSRDYIPPGPPGSNGGIQNSAANTHSGGGGGGGGAIIIECETLELISGYALQARGGNGGAAGTRGSAGSGGCGGNIIIICRNIIGSTAAIDANAGLKGAAPAIDGVAGGVYIIRV